MYICHFPAVSIEQLEINTWDLLMAVQKKITVEETYVNKINNFCLVLAEKPFLGGTRGGLQNVTNYSLSFIYHVGLLSSLSGRPVELLCWQMKEVLLLKPCG